MADGDDHIFLLDQVFIILITQLIGDFGAARIGKPFPCGGQFFENHLVNAGHGSQNIKIIGNTFGKFFGLVGELAAFHSGEPLQSQFKNGACLGFRQSVLSIDNFMTGIINQRNEISHISRRPRCGT